MKKLSVSIITLNEEKNIERCLKSVSWADEIIVVDSGSKDKTFEICEKYGCKIIKTDWLGFGRTKKLAVDSASHEWILSIDSDEELSEELKNKIKELLENSQYNGYYIKRNSFYLGKLIKYCWGNDFQLRFFNRKFGNFNDNIIHESVEFQGNLGKIKAPIIHYTYPTIESSIAKTGQYSDLSAEQMFNKGKKITLLGAVLRGFIKFFKMYIINMGFLDGKEGFVLSVISSFGVIVKYLKLWELESRSSKHLIPGKIEK
ncbi:MAG: glycosyltransferase family 2 protein [Desulfobacterales bacterium]|nr:glycosyltransferase family 2 protein [Desulfobacterales bacterium]